MTDPTCRNGQAVAWCSFRFFANIPLPLCGMRRQQAFESTTRHSRARSPSTHGSLRPDMLRQCSLIGKTPGATNDREIGPGETYIRFEGSSDALPSASTTFATTMPRTLVEVLVTNVTQHPVLLFVAIAATLSFDRH